MGHDDIAIEQSHASRNSISKHNDQANDEPETMNNNLLPTRLFSRFTLSFWLMALSFFCLFLSYNCTQNLASTVHGNKGSIAIAVLYVFFIISNFFAPAILPWFFKNNASLMMFIGSLCYTVFSIANIYARMYTLIPSAVIIGLAGGPIWVGYGVFTTSFARYMAEHSFLEVKRQEISDGVKEIDIVTESEAHPQPSPPSSQSIGTTGPSMQPTRSVADYVDPSTQRLKANLLTPSELNSLDLTTSSLTASFTTICWFVMNLNTAFGGLIAYFVLDSDEEDDLNSDSSIVRILFIIFTAICIIANISYYCTYKWTPAPTYVNVEDNNHDMEHQAAAATAVTTFADVPHPDTEMVSEIRHSYVADHETSQITHSQDDVDDTEVQPQQLPNTLTTPSTTTITTTTSTAPTVHEAADGPHTQQNPQQSKTKSHLQAVHQSLKFMGRVIVSRVILLSIPTFFSAGMALNFYFSAFLSNAVDNTLGTATVSLMTIIAATTDALVALIVNRFMKSFRVTRWCSLIGNAIQVLSLVLILVLPYHDWDTKSIAWQNSVIIGVVAGIGDAIHISGLYSGIGIVCEANTYTRSSGHAVLQTFKGLGSSFLFLTSAVMEYDDQTYLVTIIVVLSVVFQALNMLFHKDLDIEYVMKAFDNDEVVHDTAPDNNHPTTGTDQSNHHKEPSTNDLSIAAEPIAALDEHTRIPSPSAPAKEGSLLLLPGDSASADHAPGPQRNAGGDIQLATL